ncbi:uncharacterized protein LOC125070590 [Vanessa atalanta]|uniref:uncharacterized protein LOC125070590 n=1 Tax=Vanessa atalanta TaxID=42275 RepID=UPI001FCDCEF3|nr:uncharacterized protein LOC125070590 [Vanessa atalanta]
MSVPTVTINELSQGIQDYSSNDSVKTVLEGILNDYMDLQYAKETPYTTGKEVLPSGSTIKDVENSIDSDAEQKFKDIFVKISETYKSGNLTPQSENDGTWDPKYKPVLVFVTPNK